MEFGVGDVLRTHMQQYPNEMVTLVSAERLCRYVPATSLPKDLGGTQEFDHMDWINNCVDQATDANRNSRELSNEFSNDSRALEANRRAVELYTGAPSPEDRLQERTNSTQCLVPDPRGSSESLDNGGDSEGRRGVNGGEVQSPSADGDQVDSPNGDRLSNGPGSDAPLDDPPPKPPHPSEVNYPEEDRDIPEGEVGEQGEGYDHNESVHLPDGHGLDMRGMVEYVLTQKQSGIYQEYAAIRAEPPTGTFNASRHRYNLPKNRYADVVCYDHSRVCLPPINGDQFSDYINANYVDGYKQKNAFIAAQGPLPKTYADFWRLVWSEQVLTVVMTTKCMERNRQKCGQYWPAEKDSSKEYGIFKVTNLDAVREKDYTVTSMLLENTMTNEIRQVTHMQFTSWPDFGTPSSASAMLQFRKEVRWYQSQGLEAMSVQWTGHPGGPPILIHCSAGIGRTGTFCTLDISLARLEDIGTVDICNTVRKMRSQRAFTIQTPDQYEFCYLALIEYAQVRGLLEGVELDFSGYEDIESDG